MPRGALSSNVLGSQVLGLLIGLAGAHDGASQVLLAVGADGPQGPASLNVVVTLAAGLCAATLGHAIGADRHPDVDPLNLTTDEVTTVTLSKPPPVALLAMAAAVQGFVRRRRRPTLRTATYAAPLAVASTWMLAGSLVEFARNETSVDPVFVDRVSTLVRTGPNAVTRNPMYVGMTGLLISHAVLWRSATALIPAAGFAAIINASQIPAEERALAQSLPGYAEYAARVPRWLWRPTLGSVFAPRPQS